MFLLNNRPEEWSDNLSIKDLLERKNYKFKMLVIKINGKLIKKSEYLSAIIPPKAEVQVLHLMSGG